MIQTTTDTLYIVKCVIVWKLAALLNHTRLHTYNFFENATQWKPHHIPILQVAWHQCEYRFNCVMCRFDIFRRGVKTDVVWITQRASIFFSDEKKNRRVFFSLQTILQQTNRLKSRVGEFHLWCVKHVFNQVLEMSETVAFEVRYFLLK